MTKPSSTADSLPPITKAERKLMDRVLQAARMLQSYYAINGPIGPQGEAAERELLSILKEGKANYAKELESLAVAWSNAFQAFVGAFDTPVARRKDDSEYAEDARSRMREFNAKFPSALASEYSKVVPPAVVQSHMIKFENIDHLTESERELFRKGVEVGKTLVVSPPQVPQEGWKNCPLTPDAKMLEAGSLFSSQPLATYKAMVAVAQHPPARPRPAVFVKKSEAEMKNLSARYWGKPALREAFAEGYRSCELDWLQSHTRESMNHNEATSGWREAAIAWTVCASIHAQWVKGKDDVFKTRQADFINHAEEARERYQVMASE